MPTSHKTYIGDSVYVCVEHGFVKLTTENGAAPSNEIYLDPQVMDLLIAWYHHVLAVAAAELQ